MPHLLSKPTQPNAFALGLTLFLHLALLLAFLLWRSPTLVPKPQPLVLSLSEYSGDDESAHAASASAPASKPPIAPPPTPPLIAPIEAPPPPMVEIPSLAEPIDFANLEPVFDAEPDPAVTGDAPIAEMEGAANGAPGTVCPIAASVRAYLETDRAARADLARIPRASLSVANAILLWNGRWIEPHRVGGPAPARAVRAAIASSLRGASQACREEIISGPVFLPMDTGRGTIVLTLGSGNWKWAQLLLVPSPISP